jgi:mycofactocin biosynthetic radical S-adenosylmethionine protein MftC
MSLDSDNRFEDLFFPVIRRSVMLRAERTGGYISTARSRGIEDLGSVDLSIARLCNGKNSVTSVVERIAILENWPRTAAQEATWNSLRRFHQIAALDWLAEPDGRMCAPDIPKPLDEDDALLGRALSAPLSVLWDITYACNLRCAHCLTGSGVPRVDELSEDESIGVLDQLIDAKVFSITFCGGEPLLSPYLPGLIEKATSAGMEVNLDTNGLLVNEAWARKLANLGVSSVQVSIDGREAAHDRFRGRKGSFKAAVSAARTFVSLGFNVSISPVITAKTHQDLEYLAELALGLGAAGLKVSLFLPTGRGRLNARDLMLTPAQVKEDFIKLAAFQERNGDRLKIALEGAYPGLGVYKLPAAKEGNCGAGSEVGCPAGISQLVIAANGMIYACPFLYGHPAGDLRKGSLKDIWRHAGIFKIFRRMTKGQLKGSCRSCPQLPGECHGGCRAAAYAFTGDLYAEDPMCWYAAENAPCLHRSIPSEKEIGGMRACIDLSVNK